MSNLKIDDKTEKGAEKSIDKCKWTWLIFFMPNPNIKFEYKI